VLQIHSVANTQSEVQLISGALVIRLGSCPGWLSTAPCSRTSYSRTLGHERQIPGVAQAEHAVGVLRERRWLITIYRTEPPTPAGGGGRVTTVILRTAQWTRASCCSCQVN